MALLSWEIPETSARGFVEFDAVLLEEYTRSAEVSTFAVESGAQFSDHVQPQPRAITLEVFVSDTPTSSLLAVGEEGQRSAGGPAGTVQPLDLTPNLRPYHTADGRGATQIVAGLPGQRVIRGNVERAKQHVIRRHANVLQFNGEVTRIVDVFRLLDELMANRTALRVILLDSEEFDNMFIINLRAPRAAGNGTGITFSLDLVQIDQVEFATVTREKQQRKPSSAGHKPKKSAGQTSTHPTYAEEESISDAADDAFEQDEDSFQVTYDNHVEQGSIAERRSANIDAWINHISSGGA